MIGTKPIVLIPTPHYIPAFRAGGPIKSIAGLVQALGDEIDFRIVTLDRDFASDAPLEGVVPMQWVSVGKARVIYLPGTPWVSALILRMMRSVPYDTLYLNSFFNPLFSTLPLIAQRAVIRRDANIVIAPRGELSHGALSIKMLKKKAFMRACAQFNLHENLTWEASDELEAGDIRNAMLGSNKPLSLKIKVNGNIAVTGDLVADIARHHSRCRRNTCDALKIVFLSRISPKKNLDFALRALALVRERAVFTIIGPREDHSYADLCDALALQLPPHISVVHQGAVEPKQVGAELSRHDLFLLPTRGENFGHVIVEALQAGLRLLISDQTPWRDLEKEGVGYDLPLDDPAVFANIIDAEARRPDDGQQNERNMDFLCRNLRNEDRVAAARKLFSVRIQR